MIPRVVFARISDLLLFGGLVCLHNYLCTYLGRYPRVYTRGCICSSSLPSRGDITGHTLLGGTSLARFFAKGKDRRFLYLIRHGVRVLADYEKKKKRI